jgi:dipeptidyl aminopeptidase/acylaminoacyl peptidase
VTGPLLRRMVSALFIAVVLTSASTLSAQMKLRDEEISRQKEGGYSLADFSFGSVGVADFTKKDKWTTEEKLPPPLDKVQDGLLSPDGTLIALTLTHYGEGRPSLGIVQRDGGGLREYPYISDARCWSPDNRLLVAEKQPYRFPNAESVLLDVESGTVQELALPPGTRLTSQCWSPDGQKLVYYKMDRDPVPWTRENAKKKEPPNHGTIFVYDIAQRSSREVVRGQDPTWSPDGEWIAYRNDGVYYRTKASGADRQRLFKFKDQGAPLLWSPDSQTVVYFHCCYLMPSLKCMCDVGRWFIRRLADHAEIEVAEGSRGGNMVWIRPRSGQASRPIGF